MRNVYDFVGGFSTRKRRILNVTTMYSTFV